MFYCQSTDQEISLTSFSCRLQSKSVSLSFKPWFTYSVWSLFSPLHGTDLLRLASWLYNNKIAAVKFWFLSSASIFIFWPIVTSKKVLEGEHTWGIQRKKTWLKSMFSACPDWCGSVGWALSHEAKGHWFYSQLGHMPGLWLWSPVRVHKR